MNTFLTVLVVFLGGGFGSISRYGISKITPLFYEGKFPLATLITNALACTLLGILLFVFKDKLNTQEWLKYFLIVGFCGGFSTFSAFGFDTIKLMQEGLFTYAFFNILISIILGFGILYFLMR